VALSGNLRELGPLELLQMIALQRKSGLLRVDAGGRRLEIDIRQGQIAAAHPAEGRLLRMLEALDLLEPAQCERTALIAEGSDDDLLEVLLRAEGMDAESLLPALALNAQAEIDHLLAQEDGTFELATEAPPSRAPLQAGLSLERAIHEGVRRLDEVCHLRETRLTTDTTLAVADDAPPPLPGPAAHVRKLIEWHHHVPEILDASGLPAYETLTALEEMVGAGMVRITQEARVKPPVEPLRLDVPGIAARAGGVARVAAVLTVAFAVRFLLVAGVTAAPTSPGAAFLGAATEERRAMAELTLALELYRFESGNYPLSLYYLVDRRLVSQPRLEDPEGRLYDYEIAEGGNAYVLYRSVQGAPRLTYPFVEKD